MLKNHQSKKKDLDHLIYGHQRRTNKLITTMRFC